MFVDFGFYVHSIALLAKVLELLRLGLRGSYVDGCAVNNIEIWMGEIQPNPTDKTRIMVGSEMGFQYSQHLIRHARRAWRTLVAHAQNPYGQITDSNRSSQRSPDTWKNDMHCGNYTLCARFAVCVYILIELVIILNVMYKIQTRYTPSLVYTLTHIYTRTIKIYYTIDGNVRWYETLLLGIVGVFGLFVVENIYCIYGIAVASMYTRNYSLVEIVE